MILYPTFSFSGTKRDQVWTLSVSASRRIQEVWFRFTGKPLLLQRFSSPDGSMPLSVDLLFLLKAPLKKKKKCLFIDWLDHTVKYDRVKRKKQNPRDTHCTFSCLFLNAKMLQFSYAGFLMTCCPVVIPFLSKLMGLSPLSHTLGGECVGAVGTPHHVWGIGMQL